jgi:hypothetical protein
MKSRRKMPLYECASCEHQTTLIAGTIFEKTRTDLLKWFVLGHLLDRPRQARCLGHAIAEELEIAYQTAWTITHKVCKPMGELDATYTLAGIVELDEGLRGAHGRRETWTWHWTNSRARSIICRQEEVPKYLKMQVIPDVKGTILTDFATKYIEAGLTIASDRFGSYKDFGQEGVPTWSEKVQFGRESG